MGGRKKETAETAQAKLDAGEWLTAGAIAVLLRVDRGTVTNWIERGETRTGLRLRHRPNALTGYRECNPRDVARILAVLRGASPDQPDS